MHATGEIVNQRYVPCGKCSACCSRHAYNVYKRLEYESTLYEEFPLFLTLTYSDENIPEGSPYRPVCKPFDRYRKSKQKHIDFADAHSTDSFYHVSKPDWQKFMKDLRYRLGTGVRFFTLAEYGGEFGRPHYHALLFNHHLPMTHQSQAYDASEIFADIWKKGHVLCELAPTAAMKYVSGYHAIRQNSPPGSMPSFVLSSMRPGIGKLKKEDADWVRDHSFTDRALPYMKLSSYQRKQVYPDGDFLVMSTDMPLAPDRDQRVDMWFRDNKLRDHGKFVDKLL